MHLSNLKSHDPEAEALAKEIRELTFQHEEVLGEIRAKSPRYAALIQPEPLSLQEIQTRSPGR